MILTYGRTVGEALRAKRLLAEAGIAAGVILLETLSPYAPTAKRVASLLSPETDAVFLEEGIREGGAGMLLWDALTAMGACPRLYRILALSDFVTGRSDSPLLSSAGISAEDVVAAFFAFPPLTF